MPRELTEDQRRRVVESLEVVRRARSLSPRAAVFAHVRVRTGAGRTLDLLLGDETRTQGDLALLDHRTAPLAEAFFGHAEGDAYSVDLADRTAEGTVLASALLGFSSGELVEIATQEVTLAREADGSWRASAPRARAAIVPPGPRPRRAAFSIADAPLDEAQRRAVELPPGRAVLVLGEAGCGKTTVALRRLAWLSARSRRPLRAAVIVPSEGLRALAAAFVERLGLSGVEVLRYDDLAASEARRAFPDLPCRLSDGASAAVVRLKRDPALRQAIAELARRPPEEPDEDAPRVHGRGLARREDLHALFGDRAVLDDVVRRAGGRLPPHAIGETAEHTRVQFEPPEEIAFAHVLREARRTVDGLGLDARTPADDAATIDAEDPAVMFELERLRAAARDARPRGPRTYDCVVVDEAQELAPLELALVGRTLAPGGTLVVAGDGAQQIDPSAAFLGWDATLAELGASDSTRVALGVSYRSPPAIAAWTRALRNPTGAVPAGAACPSLAVEAFRHPGALVAWLVDALGDARERDPGAQLAVVCRTRAAAEALHRVVALGVTARLALDGEFAFRPGVEVTCVDEVKGLEFERLIVPDADAATYPDTSAARRALYVATTRATEGLVLAAAGRLSPLVQPLAHAAGITAG